ncbi:MAG: phosphoglycerate dehydrogenase [Christensenellales bacterium]|jgi:phosphoglycerate dehydrogenase-like enzyme
MKHVLIASRSCGSGIGEQKIIDMFESNGIVAQFSSLKDEEAMGKAQGLIIGMGKVGEAEFQRLPKLKCVMKYGVGIENIDIEAAKTRNIKVMNMPGINSEAVAEMAFALMISAARKVVEGDRSLRRGNWDKLTGYSLIGKTLGIVGTGAIGRKLAEYVKGFNMRVIAYDMFESEQFIQQGGEYVCFDELVTQSDFISIHVPLTKQTHHLFGENEFSKMKESAILVNTSRGSVVDEQALITALQDKKIAAAGLDVFEQEPLPLKSVLRELENVVIVPHIAAFSIDTMRKMDLQAIKNMTEALKNEND